MVQIGERDDQADVVLVDESTDRVDVAGVDDPRCDRVVVRMPQGRRERVEVRGDRGGARTRESRDDVDALACAGEENRGQRRPPSGLPKTAKRRLTSAATARIRQRISANRVRATYSVARPKASAQAGTVVSM